MSLMVDIKGVEQLWMPPSMLSNWVGLIIRTGLVPAEKITRKKNFKEKKIQLRSLTRQALKGFIFFINLQPWPLIVMYLMCVISTGFYCLFADISHFDTIATCQIAWHTLLIVYIHIRLRKCMNPTVDSAISKSQNHKRMGKFPFPYFLGFMAIQSKRIFLNLHRKFHMIKLEQVYAPICWKIRTL